ncbi:ABC transporter permease [Candidatus Leptofilum sp.]|uniref:ABC transporter permease n=1 Tax=Candidatus Leptofilum sp. TaxID=3241576 RepID=UPI003B5AF1EC
MTTGIETIPEQTQIGKRPQHWRVIWAIARKDIAEITTNTQFIVMSLLPVLIFLLYRLMVSGINNSSILDIVVYDLGNSQLVTAMQESPDIELHIVTSEDALQTRITEGNMTGIQIPANFDAAVAAGNMPELNVWLNPEDGLSSETANWQRFLEAEILKIGQQTLPAQIEWTDVESDVFSVGNGLNNYLLIVVLTMVFFLTGTNLVAMLITEEKEKKMGVVLINSPANPYHVALGKSLAGTIAIIAVLLIVILLNGGLTGNWPLALLFMAITLPIALGISILTGSLVHSSKQCNSWLGIGMILLLVPAWFSDLLTLPEPFGTIFSFMPTHFLVQGLSDALNSNELVKTSNSNLAVWLLVMVVVVVLTAWRLRQNPRSIIAHA